MAAILLTTLLEFMKGFVESLEIQIPAVDSSDFNMAVMREVARRLVLNSGHEIPTIGLGTFQSYAAADAVGGVATAVKAAVSQGYRLIDSAQVGHHVLHHVVTSCRALRHCPPAPWPPCNFPSRILLTLHLPGFSRTGGIPPFRFDSCPRPLQPFFHSVYPVHSTGHCRALDARGDPAPRRRFTLTRPFPSGPHHKHTGVWQPARDWGSPH
jgi:hypothetical protein